MKELRPTIKINFAQTIYKDMSFEVRVLMHNPHFSQEHADAQHGGEESENNKKLDWEDEMVLNGIEEQPEIVQDEDFHLMGEKNGEAFDYAISNMILFRFKIGEGQYFDLGASKELYLKHQINDGSLTIELEGLPYANPRAGVYIASRDFPVDLIPRDRD